MLSPLMRFSKCTGVHHPGEIRRVVFGHLARAAI